MGRHKEEKTIAELEAKKTRSAKNRLKQYEELEALCIKKTTYSFKELMHKWSIFLEEIHELYHYRRLKREERLIELPCKVGTPVYCICTSIKGTNPFVSSENFTLSMVEHVGNSVFLTKEEAEDKVKEMKK